MRFQNTLAATKAEVGKKTVKNSGKWPRRQRNTYTPRSAASFWSTCHQRRSLSFHLSLSLCLSPSSSQDTGGLLFLFTPLSCEDLKILVAEKIHFNRRRLE